MMKVNRVASSLYYFYSNKKTFKYGNPDEKRSKRNDLE
jgi:hypothetical protein